MKLKMCKVQITIHSHYPLEFYAYVDDLVEARQICSILSAGQPHAVTYRIGASVHDTEIPKYLKQAE